jgi:hypothetical protein
LPQFGVFIDWGSDLDWWTEETKNTKVVETSLLTIGALSTKKLIAERT